MLTLKGRTCVFAGATGAIGRGAVREMAENGMNVVMVTHDPGSAGEIINELKGCSGQVIAVSNKDGDAAALEQAEKYFGSVDVLISSTGALNKVKTLEDVTEEEIENKLKHQITDPLMMVQTAVPYLEKSKNGRIVFVTSGGALDGFSGECLTDSVARGGVISMTYCLAKILVQKKITVNCIARSGFINDHVPKDSDDFNISSIVDQIPVGHAGQAEEFGCLVAYIVSEEAAFTTGHVFNLTGGLHIG